MSVNAIKRRDVPDDNPLAPARKRFVSNVLNPRIVVETNDGVAHRTVSWVRLFADTDLYSAKQPKFDVWGPGVSKYVTALGAKTTPLVTSVDPVTNERRPGLRLVEDEHSGIIARVEQDVLLTYRDQQTGSPGFVIATGEVDVLHLLLGELYKLVGNRDDVGKLVTDRVKKRMENDEAFDLWIFLPYQMGGTWIAVNLEKPAVRDVLDKHREMARSDKVKGKAASKAARLALKQSNQVPMHFVASGMLRDEAGRMFVDVPVVCWNVYDTRAAAEGAINALLAKAAKAGELTFADGYEVEGVDPDDAELSDELRPDEAQLLPEPSPVMEAESREVEQAAPARQPEPAPAPAPQRARRAEPRQQDLVPPAPAPAPAPAASDADRQRLLERLDRLEGSTPADLIEGVRADCGFYLETDLASLSTDKLDAYYRALRSL